MQFPQGGAWPGRELREDDLVAVGDELREGAVGVPAGINAERDQEVRMRREHAQKPVFGPTKYI